MTRKQFYDKLLAIGLPVAYLAFPINEAPALPYIVYRFPESDDLVADNTNYRPIDSVTVELYTENKDFTLSDDVGEALNEMGLVYNRSEEYLEDERMYMTLFESEVIFNG